MGPDEQAYVDELRADLTHVVDLAAEAVPGYYRGRHYTEWVDHVKKFRRGGFDELALGLLMILIEAAELEAGQPMLYCRTRGKDGSLQVEKIIDPVLLEKFNTDPVLAGPRAVAPWYYEQAALIHAKQRRVDLEVEVLERYAERMELAGCVPRGPGAKLIERLDKAQTRLARSGN